jgi:hypothetical protein
LKHLRLGNERGQALVAALILLPLLLALFSAGLVLIAGLTLEARAAAACRLSIVRSQSEAADALNRLLALNPIAQSLETRRQHSKFALAAAIATGNVPGIKAARTALSAVEALQAPVMVKQKILLVLGSRASRAAPFRAEEAIGTALPEMILAQSSFPLSTVAHFDLIASPTGARTPTYRTSAHFENTQETKVQWLLELPGAHVARADSLDGTRTLIEVGCAATLEKIGGIWEPKMTEDKLLQN